MDADNSRSQVLSSLRKGYVAKAGWDCALIVPHGDAMHRGCRLKRDGRGLRWMEGERRAVYRITA